MRKRGLTLRCGVVVRLDRRVDSAGRGAVNGLGMILKGFWFPPGSGD